MSLFTEKNHQGVFEKYDQLKSKYFLQCIEKTQIQLCREVADLTGYSVDRVKFIIIYRHKPYINKKLQLA